MRFRQYKRVICSALAVLLMLGFFHVEEVFAQRPIRCLRWEHMINGTHLITSPSQMRLEVWRDSTGDGNHDTLLFTHDSPKTRSLNFAPYQEGGTPDDIKPSSIQQAQVGDKIIIKDLTTGTKNQWDFQRYHNWNLLNSTHYYSSSPFLNGGYQEILTKEGMHRFYLNVMGPAGWSDYGNHRTLDFRHPTHDYWWYFTEILLSVTDVPKDDQVIKKYQDLEGKTLRPDDAAAALLNGGYNNVYPNNTKHEALLAAGYTLSTPKAGYHLVYNSRKQNTHEVIFKYNPPDEAFITVSGIANPNPVTLSGGQGVTQNTVMGEVHNLRNGVTVQRMKLEIQNNSNSEWLEQTFNSNNVKQQHNFGEFQITGQTIFPIKAEALLSNNKTLTAEGQIIVYIEEPPTPPEEPGTVTPYLDYYPKPGEGYHIEGTLAVIEMSMAEFNSNRQTTVKIEMDGGQSTSNPHPIEGYRHLMRKEGGSWVDGGYMGEFVSSHTIEIELPFSPSDINSSNNRVKMQGRLGVKDIKGNQGYQNRNYDLVQFRVIIKPPETKLYLPEYFYPKQVLDLGYTNVIAWDYYSEDGIPYQQSIVSLYKLVNDVPQPIFENQIMIDRELQVEGHADEEFRIITKVVDELGNISEPATEDFVIMNASPIIKVTLDTSKEDENLLGVNVENLTPSVIESIFPTQYSSWKIVDMNGITLEQGMGKVPAWVDLDERYEGNIATVIQYAENILGNTAQDHATYINNSVLDFIINPEKLFEMELTQITDLSKSIENKEWQIQNTLESERNELLLDEEMKFTREEGRYLIWLFGDGRFAHQRNLYQYSNNKADLRTQLPTAPTNSFIKTSYGEEYSYAYHTAKWNGEIQQGNYTYEGNSYKYRRMLSYYTTSESQSYRARNVEFISGKPEADLKVSGTLKMYKKITLDGTGSIEKTIAKNPELQERYPIQFSHERTLFMIEPLTDNQFDPSKNQYILGHGREVIDGKVVFRGKDIQHVRFDKEGLYRILYKVFNGLRESDFVEEIIYVAEERYPTVEIEILSPLVYRNPNNELKSELRVTADYKLPDEEPKDEIDFERSRLLVAYDANYDGNFTNDGEHSNQWVMKDSETLLDYITVVEKDFQEEKAIFTFEVDNETKNLLGQFKFEFEVYEKPSVPNYLELGPITDIRIDTFDIEEEKKRVLVDNQKPVIHLSAKKENEVEIFFVDSTGNIQEAEEQIEAILNQLKINRINATVYLIKEDGSIQPYNN